MNRNERARWLTLFLVLVLAACAAMCIQAEGEAELRAISRWDEAVDRIEAHDPSWVGYWSRPEDVAKGGVR